MGRNQPAGLRSAVLQVLPLGAGSFTAKRLHRGGERRRALPHRHRVPKMPILIHDQLPQAHQSLQIGARPELVLAERVQIHRPAHLAVRISLARSGLQVLDDRFNRKHGAGYEQIPFQPWLFSPARNAAFDTLWPDHIRSLGKRRGPPVRQPQNGSFLDLSSGAGQERIKAQGPSYNETPVFKLQWRANLRGGRMARSSVWWFGIRPDISYPAG